MGIGKISATLVLELFSAPQREHYVEYALVLKLLWILSKPILKSVFTRDDTIVLHYDFLIKKEAMEWRRPDKPCLIKAKVVQSTETNYGHNILEL